MNLCRIGLVGFALSCIISVTAQPLEHQFGGNGPALRLPFSGDWNPRNPGDELGYFEPHTSTIVLCDEHATAAVHLTCHTLYLDSRHTDVQPMVGRWQGETRDQLALYETTTGRTSFYRFPEVIDCGAACVVHVETVRTDHFGAGGDRPVAGDWDGDGTDSIALLHLGGAVTLFEDGAAVAHDTWDTSLDVARMEPVAGRWRTDSPDLRDHIAFFDPRCRSGVLRGPRRGEGYRAGGHPRPGHPAGRRRLGRSRSRDRPLLSGDLGPEVSQSHALSRGRDPAG